MSQFTVAIPVYNGARFLGDALASIAAQDLDGVEILVSDNASTDETPRILEEWSKRLPIRTIRHAQMIPMRDHFNALLDAIDGGSYMLLCHDDYLARPDALTMARRVLSENPGVAAVYCDLLYVDEQGGRLTTRRFGRSGPFDVEEAGERALRSGRNLFGIPLAIRRASLDEIRYGDAFLYTMDIDLSWSLGRAGGAWHIAQPLIANRYSGSNTTWRLLWGTYREYIALSAKYRGPPSPIERLRIVAVCSLVGLQKLIFHLYERAGSWRA